MKIKSKNFIPTPEVLNSLKKRKVKDLTYEQKICLDFLKKHVKMKVTDARKLMEELQEIGRINERQASMVVNILPTTKDEVKLIFSKERTTPKDEELKKIADTVKKYV